MLKSTKINTQFLKLLKALGKTQVNKSTVTVMSSTAGSTVTITGDGLQISFSTDDATPTTQVHTFALADIGGILSLDKVRFDLEQVDELHCLLNDMPVFKTSAIKLDHGQPKTTVEIDDVGPYANKPVLPAINKLLKKSLIRESEYLLWRITESSVQLCQIFPTDWGVRFEANGEFGAALNAFTNKLENKLIAQLFSGRFKVSTTDTGYIFADSTYSVFIADRDWLNAKLYPPFNE